MATWKQSLFRSVDEPEHLGASGSGRTSPDPDATSDWSGRSDKGDEPAPLDADSVSTPREARPSSIGKTDLERLQGFDLPLISGFHLIRELGSGGFGRVYEAVSTDSVGHRVAIKVLFQPSPSAARAFDTERKILANLSHPNIARYISSGALDDGRPWMAMEFVEGMRIDRYCEREQLSTGERLALFRKVCDAVQHAHEFGIWHLDLKPQNILVTVEGEPKLLDFGIAKVSRALDSAAGASHTRGYFTYLYSSPEQLRGEPLSSRSDVYNLGLILYELLTGTRVRNPEVEKIEDFIRLALQTDPELPSVRVSRHTQHTGGSLDLGLTGTTSAQGGPSRLSRKLRGDLDNIMLMALRREPTKRYESPKALADDIGRHLENLPVEARRASTGYRFARELQRRRVAIGIAALLMFSATAGSIALWANAERTRAVEKAESNEKLLVAEGERIAALAKQYEKVNRDLGWLEVDYSSTGVDALAAIRAQLDFERLFIESQRDAGKLTSIAVAEHLKTVYRYAAACKRRRKAPEGIEALERMDPLLSQFPQLLDDAMADASLRARLDEIHADLLTVADREADAVSIYERAVERRMQIVESSKGAQAAIYHLNKVRQRMWQVQMDRGQYDAAVQTATAMRTARQGLLAALTPADDPRKPDRFQRDVMVADHWCAQSQLAAGMIPDAEASAASMLALARARLLKADGKSHEPAWDLALALQDSASVQMSLARYPEAEALLAEASRNIDEAIARSQVEAGPVTTGFEIACLRVSALLLSGDNAGARRVADGFATDLERTARAVPDRPVATLKAEAGDPAAEFELLRLLALLATAEAAPVSERVLAIRKEMPDLESRAELLPVWIVELGTARARLAQGDSASAQEALGKAIALAMRSRVVSQRVQCALWVRAVCSTSEIPASSVAGYGDAIAAVGQVKGAALRAHFEKRVAQVDAVRE